MRLLGLGLLALCLLVPAAASAGNAKVHLETERVQARAAQGEPVRVIVSIRVPNTAIPRTQDQLLARQEVIRQVRENLLARTFGDDLVEGTLPREATGFDEGRHAPVLLRVYDNTAGMAMKLTSAQMDQLAGDAAVLRISEDRLSKPSLDESVPLIGAPVVWERGYDGSGYAVAVLDTGVSMDHEMIAGRIVSPACFSTRDATDHAFSLCENGASQAIGYTAGKNCPVDDPATSNLTEGIPGCFHGTHVASIAMGGTASFNGHTITGVAKGAKVMPIQVFSEIRDADSCDGAFNCVLSYTSDQMAALDYVIGQAASAHVAAVNMSLGGGLPNLTNCDADNSAMKSQIDTLRGLNVATVIASGNDSYVQGISSPACISSAVAVGAVDKQLNIADFSNSSDLVDMLAPGVNIRAAYPFVGGQSYAVTASGTSMAAPHVAGAFALLRSAHPAATVGQIESALKNTGTMIVDGRNGVFAPMIRVDLADQLLTRGSSDFSSIALTPDDGYSARGYAPDPDSFPAKTYTLTNNGTATVEWTVASSDATTWLLDKSGGTLAPGESDTVTVNFDPDKIWVGGSETGSITFSAEGQTAIRSASAYSIHNQPNDDFANAFVERGFQWYVNGNNLDATREAGEPVHTGGNDAGNSSVWYDWTAPFTGKVKISLKGSKFDTALGVYTGNAVNNLTVIVQNDDVIPGQVRTSEAQFNATKGTRYHIAIDGWDGDFGTFSGNLDPADAPANDDFANAQLLTGNAGNFDGFNINATGEDGESPIIAYATDNEINSVWFKWTAPSTGGYRFFTDGSDIRTMLGVYTGSSIGALTTIATNDNSKPVGTSPEINVFTSSVLFQAQQGTTYMIAVDGVGSDKPQGMIHLGWFPQGQYPQLASSVLPNTRSVRWGQAVTAFTTVINGGTEDGHKCRLELAGQTVTGDFSYQTTNSQNELTGQANTPVELPVGASQSFVFSFRPVEIFYERTLWPMAVCDNARYSARTYGLNNFLLSSSDAYLPDMVTVSDTLSHNGVLSLDGDNGTGFVVVATSQLGGDAPMLLVTAANRIPVNLTVCETNPATSVCLAPPTDQPLAFDSSNGEQRTFAIFAQGTGTIPFDPTTNRIKIIFTDEKHRQRGGSSVAVTTETVQ